MKSGHVPVRSVASFDQKKPQRQKRLPLSVMTSFLHAKKRQNSMFQKKLISPQ
jgi:hypothetical protein